MTYCYRSTPHNILTGRDGWGGLAVDPGILAAKARGILFDIGHGGNAFDLTVAEAAIAQGFLPDTISTDLHSQVPWDASFVPGGGFRVGVDTGRHELVRVMAKLEACGMSRLANLAAVTTTPAKVLGLAGEIGTLAAGSCADIVVLGNGGAGGDLHDHFGNRRAVSNEGLLEPLLTVRAGLLVGEPPPSASL